MNKKETLTQEKAKETPAGGVVVGKRNGQTMIYDDASVGGYFVGKLHSEGGIKMINKSTGQPLEVQGAEVIITAPAVADQTKREFEGRMMTNREILSEINKRGGGVSFADGGNIPIEMHFSGNSYKYGGKTVSDHDIAYEISKCGCEHDTLSEGGKIDEMPTSIKKKIYTADGERKITPVAISILTNYVNSLPQTKDLNTDSKGNYTKERQELHRKIIDDFKDELICIQKDEPIAILMGGSPASGKSTFLRKYAPYLLKEEILKVDADEIRSMLPEYKGYNATQTHLETKDIVNTLLSDKTIGIPCKYDIIYDGTMNSTKSYLPLITLLKSLGYKIFIVYIDKVPEEVVKKRALERYKKSGRFVPMEVIDDFFGKGKVALEELKLKSDGYMIIDGSSGDYNILEKKGLRLPKKRMYSKLGEPLSKLEQLAHGGHLSKGMSLKQIAKMHGVSLLELNRQVKMGLSAESEHTPKVTEQMKIVKDHLYENPNYYTLLKEAGLKKGGEVDYVTYKDKYNKKYNYDKNTSHTLEDISDDTGVSIKGLQQIYNKGIGAYKTNPSSVRPNVKSKEQWAMARVYSAVMGGKASEVDSNELKMNHGGKVEYSLVKDAKSGNSPSRDLNNYNDLMDVQADGAVGGDIGVYADGGALGASGLPLVDYVEITNGGSHLNQLKTNDKFYDFQSLKKRVAEIYKLLPNTSTNIYRGYIEAQAYDTEGNQLVIPNTYISDMKNTVKNFNPYTGKPSDLEKSFAKSRPISFKKYDWSEWFSGKKSMPSTQASAVPSSKLLTGLYILYTNPTNNSVSSFTVDNASEFLYTLINLYKNSIKKIDYKPIINEKLINYLVFRLVLSDDPQDNWRTIDFRMNPNVTTVDDVAYRLKEQYNNLDLSKFIVSNGLNAIGQPNGASTAQPSASTTSNLVEVPDNDPNFDKVVKSLPAPILALLMIRAIEQGINVDNDTLEQRITLIKNKIDGKIFGFSDSQEGGLFWSEISKGRFTEFKRLYGKYGEKVKDIKINIPTTASTSASKTLSKKDLEEIKIKINSDFDLALKVVEILEQFGFNDTSAIRRRIENKEQIHSIGHGTGIYVGWFEDEDDFNNYNRKEIFPSDLGILSTTTSANAQPTATSTSGLIEIPDSNNNFDGKVLSLPSPILELLSIRIREQNLGNISQIFDMPILGIRDDNKKLFSFENSADGFNFWSDISQGDFTKFKQKYGKYGEKVKDIVGTATTSSGKFTSAEIKLFEGIDDIVKEFNLSVKYPILELYPSPITKELDLVNEDTGEVFYFRSEYGNLGVQKADADKDKSTALLKDYLDWKKGQSTSATSTSTAQTTTAQPASTPSIKFSFDLELTKIWIGDNPELSRRVQERAMELGFDWWSGDKKPRNLEMQSLFFSDNEKITGGDTRESFDSFNDHKEIFESNFFGSATTATQQQNNSIPNDIAENIANDNRVTACLFTDVNANEDVRYYLKKIWEYFVNMLEQDTMAQSFFHFENKDNKSISVKARFRYGIKSFQADNLFIQKNITKDDFYLLIFDRYPELDFTNVLYDFEIDFYNEYKSTQKILSQSTQTNAPLTEEQKIASEFVANDSELRRNDMLGSASLQQDRNDLDALSKLLPSFQQSKFSNEKTSILKEMARIQKKLDYKGFIASNEEVSKGKDLFTPQGLLNYYFTQATQNPTAELQPPCELPTPNGGKSKLPLVAYLNVRSSQFKKWFGDWEKAYETDNYVNCSKMIDEETKEPKIFYHGVRKYIPSFGQMSNMGVGVVRPYGSFEPPNFPASYFADNESYANFYGGIAENMPKPSEGYKPFIYKVFLCIKNPISLLPLDFEISYRDLIDYVLVAYGIRLNVSSVLLKQLGEDMDKKHPIWIYIRRDIGLIEMLKDKGYDALIQQGDIPVFDKNGEVVSDRSKFIKDTEYLSFYPNQVKSATVKKSFYFNFFNDIRFKKGGYVRI